ncbi:MAG: hypothetical protein V9E89_16180 [Ilumatobacteraceae bacterium]
MRRTLAGFLFALSYAALCLAAGGFLLQRTVFDPDLTADAAAPVLQEPAILKELTKRIAAATTAELGKSTIEIEALVNSVAANAEGARILSDVFRDAHARLIGQQRGPVQITATQMVQIVRSERVGGVAPLTIPVPRASPRWTSPGRSSSGPCHWPPSPRSSCSGSGWPLIRTGRRWCAASASG